LILQESVTHSYKVYGDLKFCQPTWLNNFPFPSSAPLTLLSSLSGWPEAGTRRFFDPRSFLPLGAMRLSFVTVVFDFKYDGPGLAKGGTGMLSVDGKEVAKKTIPHTIPFVETIDETFDVGVDTRTGVDDKDYQPPFRFSGKINKLTVKLVPLKAAEEMQLKQKVQDTRNKAQ
jgi:hypothetical protein